MEQKKEIYVPYNVLPLDQAGASQAIMQLDEVWMGRCVVGARERELFSTLCRTNLDVCSPYLCNLSL